VEYVRRGDLYKVDLEDFSVLWCGVGGMYIEWTVVLLYGGRGYSIVLRYSSL